MARVDGLDATAESATECRFVGTAIGGRQICNKMQIQQENRAASVICKIMPIRLHPNRASSEVANAVRGARREQALRQEDLALAAGISTKTLHNIETGSARVRLDTLIRVLQVLGLALEIAQRAPAARTIRE
jgi:DNA-binding XRE family transcriptional regulator